MEAASKLSAAGASTGGIGERQAYSNESQEQGAQDPEQADDQASGNKRFHPEQLERKRSPCAAPMIARWTRGL